MKYIKLLIIGIAIGFFSVSLYFHYQQPTTYTKEAPPQAAATESKTIEATDPVAITFVGDMMFDRYIRAQAEAHGYEHILADVRDQLSMVDLVVANLEGPITNFSSVSTYDQNDPNHFRFTFPPQVADLLATHNIHLVSIGNNHIENFGTAGVKQTTDLLKEAGIQLIGHPDDRAQISTTTEINNQLFGFTTYNYADSRTAEKTVDEITRLKALSPTPDWIIVYAHWGQEYQHQPSEAQQDLARKFVDAGADLVIGAHPHVIQHKEMYNDSLIYYSLGNFVFDQYFSPEVRCGLMVTATFSRNSRIQVDESFVELAEDGSTHPSSCQEEVPTLY